MLSLPAMLHGSENWTIKARDARRITEIKYMCVCVCVCVCARACVRARVTAEYTWADYKTNT
jgi:hypothetical protein